LLPSAPFFTGANICPPLQACGRVRKVNETRVQSQGFSENEFYEKLTS
jgi:hypothetical protein